MSSWHNYPQIFNVGHREVVDILKTDVNVEEKVDGSQFSFGIFDGEIMCRSKGAKLIVDAPEKMFERAVASVKEIAPMLHNNWTYRGEYLAKPKHNTLCYERHPINHIIIFDVNTDEECYLPYNDKLVEAHRIGLECVPLLFSGKVETIDQFRKFLDTMSILGSSKIEGVVIKPTGYDVFGRDKKCIMAKFVSEAFKEIHGGEWKKNNPTNKDIISEIGQAYKTDARWHKALQHIKERGELEDSCRDIPKIMKEVPIDIEKECCDEIKERLWKQAWPSIRRIVCSGLPEWYKEQLLKKQFESMD
jgi:hypothetical protein